MSRILLFSAILVFSACADKISTSELHHLNGYWEIQKVVFPQGDTKKYKLNTTIDFFFLEDDKGYRKKVQPRLDGTYITSDDAEYFSITHLNDSFKLHYSNELSEWEEGIIEISDEKITIVSEENIRYYYKRYQPIAVEK